MCVLSVLFDVLVHYCCLVTLGPTQDCVGIIHLQRDTQNHHCMSRISLVQVHDCWRISFLFDLLTLLLGNWFWYTTVVRPNLPQGQHTTVSSQLVLGSAILLEPHANPVRSRGAHLRGCSSAPFPVEVPSIGAAVAALMGMVINYLIFSSYLRPFCDEILTAIFVLFSTWLLIFSTWLLIIISFSVAGNYIQFTEGQLGGP